jgi:hypothetical protein
MPISSASANMLWINVLVPQQQSHIQSFNGVSKHQDAREIPFFSTKAEPEAERPWSCFEQWDHEEIRFVYMA